MSNPTSVDPHATLDLFALSTPRLTSYRSAAAPAPAHDIAAQECLADPSAFRRPLKTRDCWHSARGYGFGFPIGGEDNARAPIRLASASTTS
jgi:hypothetical protein